MDLPFSIYPLGDSALTIEFGSTVSPELNNLVWDCHSFLSEQKLKGVKSLVGAYNSLTLHYDSWEVKKTNSIEGSVYQWLEHHISDLIVNLPSMAKNVEPVLHIIPVCYETAFAPDLSEAAASLGLSTEALINIHIENAYRVYLIGFLPGFLYLGSLPANLQLKRKSTPALIKKGSVAMAGWQTGIYPADSPGGWHCIGRTPIRLFDIEQQSPFPWKAGDAIQFVRISENRFSEIEKTGQWDS